MSSRKLKPSPISKRQVNINLTAEGRQCLNELTIILDQNASTVVNQALRAWRLSDEIVSIDQRKQGILGSDPASVTAKSRKLDSRDGCECSAETTARK
jgi:hypothetical protein